MSVVLVADSSDLARQVLREYCTARGHTVVVSGDGIDAYRHVCADKPAVVIAETHLPGIDGSLLARLIKGRPRTRAIHVVAYSGDDSPRTRARLTLAGADLFLVKDESNLESLDPILEAAAEHATGDDGGGCPEPPEAEGVLELLAAALDEELFVAGAIDRLWNAAGDLASLPQTVRAVLELLLEVADLDIAAVVLRYHREARTFLVPAATLVQDDVERFRELIQEDFFRRPGTEAVRGATAETFGTDERDDFRQVRMDGRRVSSYYAAELRDGDEHLVGTVHAGKLSNNYFTGAVSDELDRYMPVLATVLGNAVRYADAIEGRRKINTVFAKFVPEEIISDLLSQSEDAEMAVGEKRSVAILFSDIRSFTVISEHNPAERIVSFLNAYLEYMVRIIRKHGGFVDKFIGDAILAVFGAPISYEDNALRAVTAAQEMAEAVGEIDVEGLVLPEGGFASGVGVHEGPVIVGNIGSSDKFDYTVIGDNVNLASRLEGLTKHYHVQVLLSDVVRERLPEGTPLREVDTVRVKGKEQASTLYTTVDPARFDAETAEHYRKGLSMYKLGNWATGTDYFRNVLQRHPDDFLASMYVDRCRDFAVNPPDPDWGGAIKLDFK